VSDITIRLEEDSHSATVVEDGRAQEYEFVFTPFHRLCDEYQELVARYGMLGLLGTRERET
jgi:hypothetical protein